MPSLSRLSAITLSVIAGGAYYSRLEKWLFGSENDSLRNMFLLNGAKCAEFSASLSFPSAHPSPQNKWDHNWDNREPKYMVNPTEYEEADPVRRQNMLNEAAPTSKRNIILIRHGQYFTNHNDKNYLSLTPLGQEQAKCVGQRLASSGLKFDSVVMSTMTRAEETAKLILTELPPTSVKSDPLLEEGAPFPPEPPSKHWRPKHKFPPEGWLRMSVGHCSITWLVIYPNGFVSVKSLGDIGHLPSGKLSMLFWKVIL
uniref:Serine/threonine-protein phosphatase PGAM5, mitochondrial n=1 Tax=Wuchereria bancrofti TaxID=6293 RepID=A0A1I8F0E0_WUCBA